MSKVQVLKEEFRDGQGWLGLDLPSWFTYFFRLIVQIILWWYIKQEKAIYLMSEAIC